MSTALWDSAVRLRCPACGQGRLFERWFDFRPACEACGQVLDMGEGNFVGGIYLNYGFLGIMSFLIYQYMEAVGTYTTNQEVGIMMAFVIVVPLVTVRHTRAFFLATMYSTGSLPRDKEPIPVGATEHLLEQALSAGINRRTDNCAHREPL